MIKKMQYYSGSEDCDIIENVNLGNNPGVIFMFPGYGEHYQGMAKELYNNLNLFRQNLNHCATIIKEKTSFDIIDLLYNSENDQEKTNNFDGQMFSGVSLFSVEIALALSYIQLGIKPRAMIGYSMGEYASACISGVLSLEDAFTLILGQAKYIDLLPNGCMLAVPLSKDDVNKYLKRNEIDLAAVNSPKVSILSGSRDAIMRVKELIKKENRVECMILNSNYGFHSYLMEPAMADITKMIRTIKINHPQIKYISSITGNWISDNDLNDINYWALKLRETVHFDLGIQKILEIPSQILLEVGPRQSLSLLVKNHPEKQKGQHILGSLPHFPSTESELSCFLSTLDKLQQIGIQVDRDLL